MIKQERTDFAYDSGKRFLGGLEASLGSPGGVGRYFCEQLKQRSLEGVCLLIVHTSVVHNPTHALFFLHILKNDPFLASQQSDKMIGYIDLCPIAFDNKEKLGIYFCLRFGGFN